MDRAARISGGMTDLMPPGVEARLYQQRIVNRAVDLLTGEARNASGKHEAEAGSVMIESPTGSGKTVMGLAVARALQQRFRMTVGWAAMRRNLLRQAAAENERFGFGLDLRLISMFDRRPPAVDLLVVDEAQHDGALSMASLHAFIKPRKILGLSATPFRSDRIKLCFERWIRDAGIHRLIQDGYLSPYHHYTIPRYTPEAVAETYAREPQRWGQSLMFFHTMAECRACCRRLIELGIGCELVTASTDRDRQIADFAAGRVPVMVNMLILSEGFDCPSLRTVFCRPSGRLCTVQMAGRVLRRHAGIPFKQVVQCAETRYPFPRTAAPAEQYLFCPDEASAGGGGWRTLKANARLDAMTARMQELIAGSRTTLPQLLVRHATAAAAAGSMSRTSDLEGTGLEPGIQWRRRRHSWQPGSPLLRRD